MNYFKLGHQKIIMFIIFFKPCVVFCGHPSLRFGDVVHFVEYWGTNPQNTIIFTGKLIS